MVHYQQKNRAIFRNVPKPCEEGAMSRQRKSTREILIALLIENPGQNFQFYLKKIDAEFGLSKAHLSSALNSLLKAGLLERQGQCKRYSYKYTPKQKEKRSAPVRQEITPEYLRENYSFNPQTGRLTRKKCRYRSLIGTDPTIEKGYAYLSIKGIPFLAHRVAWAIHFGAWPEHLLDHINGIKTDNRICNLREATHKENLWNNHSPVKAKSGYRGVHKLARSKRYVARIRHNRKLIDIGYYDTAEEASEAYKAEAMRIRGEFYREPNQ